MATSTVVSRYVPSKFPQLSKDDLSVYLTEEFRAVAEAIKRLVEVVPDILYELDTIDTELTTIDSEITAIDATLDNAVITPLTVAADDTAAGSAGVPANGLYQTTAGIVMSRNGAIANSCCVTAHRNGTDLTGLTAGTANLAIFTTEDFDQASFFNTSNSKFLPTLAGKYEITLQVNSLAGTGGETCQAQIKKNGTNIANGGYLAASALASGVNNTSSFTSVIVDLNGSTDYIEPFVYLPATITAMVGSRLGSFFCARRVG